MHLPRVQQGEGKVMLFSVTKNSYALLVIVNAIIVGGYIAHGGFGWGNAILVVLFFAAYAYLDGHDHAARKTVVNVTLRPDGVNLEK